MIVGGCSWVTPLGHELELVWERLLAGDAAPIETLTNEQNGAHYLVRRVAPESLPRLPSHSRLRRASAISRFAAAAGLAALGSAPFAAERTALIFAISNGGVIYTRRFYADVVKSGAQSASPLLFPETVFNAPASHLAAILGITGASYTVVGDGAVGILALKLAEDLLMSSSGGCASARPRDQRPDDTGRAEALPSDTNQIEACLVVGAEEIDPLVCEAYRQWRLLRDPERPESARGIILSEGAGAVLLRRNGDGAVEIDKIDAGATFFRRSEAPAKLRQPVMRVGEDFGFCIGSANGTFIDRAEQFAVPDNVPVYSPKLALGDSIGASVLWQVVAAAQALRTARVPGTSAAMSGPALVLACGLNQQLGAVTLRRRI